MPGGVVDVGGIAAAAVVVVAVVVVGAKWRLTPRDPGPGARVIVGIRTPATVGATPDGRTTIGCCCCCWATIGWFNLSV